MHASCLREVASGFAGRKERYSGTEHGIDNLVDKECLEIVVLR